MKSSRDLKILQIIAIIGAIVVIGWILWKVFLRWYAPGVEYCGEQIQDSKWEISTNAFTIQSAPAIFNVDLPQRIPRILHQTAPQTELDIQVYETCMINRGMNPEYEYRFYTDQEVHAFIQTHFPQYVDLFETVIPGAYRADLFRYMVLYVHGGVYLDCKSSTILPLRDFLPPNATFASFRDRVPGTIQISFLSSTPQHPVIGACIVESFRQIARQAYGRNDLDITGPMVCGRMFNRVLGRDELAPIDVGRHGVEGEWVILGTFKVVRSSQNYEILVDAFDRPLVSRACGSYYQGGLWTPSFNRYSYRWLMRRVYQPKTTA
jgi:hypothetical protein